MAQLGRHLTPHSPSTTCKMMDAGPELRYLSM
jgi:hypothetical protein